MLPRGKENMILIVLLKCEIYRLFHAPMGQGDFAPGKNDRFVGGDLQACDGEEVTWYPQAVFPK